MCNKRFEEKFVTYIIPVAIHDNNLLPDHEVVYNIVSSEEQSVMIYIRRCI